MSALSHLEAEIVTHQSIFSQKLVLSFNAIPVFYQKLSEESPDYNVFMAHGSLQDSSSYFSQCFFFVLRQY